ncbi:SDR family oxidoreductase [Sulfurospirillum arsenophilum]|uniref:SDR family oxidoreductase n=1 Tax=Sulfurospirillum arsenophilum TaxID=56698 RepID=UPI0005A95D86|nr:SDR family oxidoreductase [Sulfurospirillum arsenophilum]
MKTVLVTGASHGIGKAIAEKLCQQYRVFALDKEVPTHHFFERFYMCDLSNTQEVQKTISQIKNEIDTLYGLVNNAGIFIHKSLNEQSLQDWEKVIAVNLTAPYLLSQSFAPFLNHGHIINIASTRAFMSEAGTEPYSASKGGIVALTHALSISLSGQVSVNSISPGWINTDESYVATVEEKAWHASGRIGKPSDVAEVVSFLLEREDGFITGSDFVVDGGVSKKMVYP